MNLEQDNLEKFYGDVTVPIRVGMGKKGMIAREALDLREGAIVSLGVEVGEPIDVSIAGTLMARGEVILINNNYGIRITELTHEAPSGGHNDSTK